MITPNTNITLLKTPFELDSINQLTFSSKEAQFNYFNSLPKISYSNATYQRKEGVIRFPTSVNTVTYEDLLEYNYCMYQNDSYDDKWFYAYITDIMYDNDGMSLITIETDVFQTWQFDIIYKQSFIEREMLSTNDDVAGVNTIPENLELGEYVINNSIKNTSLNASKVILGVTVDYYFDANNNFVLGGNNGGGTYGGVKTAYKYFYFEPNSNLLKKAIEGYATNGQSDAIGQIFLAPTFLIDKQDPTILDDGNVADSINPTTYAWDNYGDANITKLTSLNGYTPKNKKLLTYPYCYLLMTNNNGGNAIYHYELFKNPTGSPQNICNFTIQGTLTPSMSGLIVPVHYKGANGNNYTESLALPKWPICGWNTDVYTNWLTANAINIGVQVVSASTQIVSGGAMIAATGGGASLEGASNIMAGSTQIANLLGEVRQHKLVSPQAEGNTNTGDISYASNNTTITAYAMSIREEYARIIDSFFNMYGYKTNRVKLPNLNNRSNWNYVKTINCNIIGDIPQKDLQAIKDLFNNGITLWHNASTFLDYSQNNI